MSETWVLLYHGIAPRRASGGAMANDCRLTVTADDLRQQLAGIRELDLPCRSLDQVLTPKSGSTGASVAITFDDGYRNNYEYALPALVDAGCTACFYVVAGKIGQDRNYMTAAQLRDMDAAGMTIGSHTMTHAFLSDISTDQVRRELADSRALLEDTLGREVLHFAIPGGHYDRRVIKIARECGYRSVATCKVGLFHHRGDPFQIPRFEIRDGLTVESFKRTFEKDKVLQLQALEYGKACLRNTLGLSAYGRVRRVAHQWFKLTR